MMMIEFTTLRCSKFESNIQGTQQSITVSCKAHVNIIGIFTTRKVGVSLHNSERTSTNMQRSYIHKYFTKLFLFVKHIILTQFRLNQLFIHLTSL